MDPHTLEILQFDRVLALIAMRTATALGKDAVRSIAPSTDLAAIARRLNLTTEMTEALSARLDPPLGGLRDIRSPVRRAAVGAVLDPAEIVDVVATLRAIAELRRWLDRIADQFPRLGGLKEGLGEFSAIAAEIDRCLDRKGAVVDSASKRLAEIRRESATIEAKIRDQLRALIRSPEIRRCLRYAGYTMVEHHYVLPVAKDFRGMIEGSVQRTSAANETVYIEPKAVAERSAQLALSRAREAREVRRILRLLSANIGRAADSLLPTLENLAELDLIAAQARYALDFAMTAPDLQDASAVALRKARHPLLEALFRGETAAQPQRSVVPIDIPLGSPHRMMIVTGPNTGGKTAALKTAALLAAMAQAGLHIPAQAGSRLPIFDKIMADIGDEQALEQSLSTFSAHMRRINEILAAATERSLVVLDELGAGTDPAEGAALARAILDELDSIGCLTLVTTHLGDLKTYAASNDRAVNAAVAFDLETLAPKFELKLGDSGQSNALAIARRLRVAEHIVARAEGYLARSPDDSAVGRAVEAKLRLEAEAARTEADRARADAGEAREALAQAMNDLTALAQASVRLDEARARLKPGDRVVVERLGRDRPGRLVRINQAKRTAVVAIARVQWDVGLDELIPLPPQSSESIAALDRASAVARREQHLD